MIAANVRLIAANNSKELPATLHNKRQICYFWKMIDKRPVSGMAVSTGTATGTGKALGVHSGCRATAAEWPQGRQHND